MDRYDRIIRDIQQKTDEEIIRWKIASTDLYSGIILNSGRVIRTFSTDYPVGKKEYELIFVEKKTEYHDEFGDAEGYGFEVFVLGTDRQVVLTLYDGVVDRDDLLRLSGLIDAHNDRAKEFFDAFDASELA